MSIAASSIRSRSAFYATLLSILLLAGCSKQAVAPQNQEIAQQHATTSDQILADGLPTARSQVVSLPMGFTRDTGDLKQW